MELEGNEGRLRSKVLEERDVDNIIDSVRTAKLGPSVRIYHADFSNHMQRLDSMLQFSSRSTCGYVTGWFAIEHQDNVSPKRRICSASLEVAGFDIRKLANRVAV